MIYLSVTTAIITPVAKYLRVVIPAQGLPRYGLGPGCDTG